MGSNMCLCPLSEQTLYGFLQILRQCEWDSGEQYNQKQKHKSNSVWNWLSMTALNCKY